MTVGEDEFSALVERHQPAVFRWAVALMGNFDDAEDVKPGEPVDVKPE